MRFSFSKYLQFIVVSITVLTYTSCVRYEEFPIGKTQVCDCETLNIKGNKFIGSDSTLTLFDGGKLQNNEFHKSGKHSVLTDPKNKFALSYIIKNCMPSQYYNVVVWRKSTNHKGVLVAAANDGDGFYAASEKSVETDENGWEKLELDVFIPYNFVKRDIKVYVWNNSEDIIYFDDLKIKRLVGKEYPEYSLSPLHIQLDTSAFIKLETKRQAAFENGILQSSDNDWIKGILFQDTNIYNAKLRLKGDWLDHLEGDKWSFRIKLKKSYSWDRLRTFSVQTPAARDYLREWVAHKIFENQDVLTTRYGFVPLYINNSSRGLYAWEEHFQKQLLESRNRREGPILKFTEDGFWQSVKLESKYKYKSNLPYYQSSLIVPFGTGKTIENPVLYHEFLIAQKLMKQYKDQSASVEEILDVDKFARFFALVDLLRAFHSRAWHNQRFYYNPIISKLEPIAYDGFGEDSELYLGIHNNYAYRILHNEDIHENEFDLISRVFHDKTLIDKYITYLKKFSSDKFVQSQLSNLKTDIIFYDSIIRMEFPNEIFDTNYLYRSAKDIRNYLPELERFLGDYSSLDKSKQINTEKKYSEDKVLENTPEFFVNAYQNNRQNDSLSVEVFNYYPRKVKLLGTGFNNEFIDFYLPKGIDLSPYNNGENKTLTFISDTMANYLFFVVDGSEEIFKKEINRWPYPEGETPQQNLLKLVNLSDTAIFTKVVGKDIYIKKGDLEIREPIIIPAGYTVNIEPGTRLNLVDSAFILSYSSFEFHGSKANPIIITSTDFTARGVTVLQAEKTSNLEYVNFENLNTFYYRGWGLTGALTFYESDVHLDYITFYRNQCEDALNIVRCEFTLNSSSFDNIYGDAFDSDFSSGTVQHVKFTNIGNDAIDFSGSKILIKNTLVSGAADKGISGGEDSHLTVKDCIIEKANIGIASKDLSVLKVFNTKVLDCNYGFVLLQKKAEYGPAEIYTDGVTLQNSKVKMLIEQGSKVVESGKIIYGKEKNVAKLFY